MEEPVIDFIIWSKTDHAVFKKRTGLHCNYKANIALIALCNLHALLIMLTHQTVIIRCLYTIYQIIIDKIRPKTFELKQELQPEAMGAHVSCLKME